MVAQFMSSHPVRRATREYLNLVTHLVIFAQRLRSALCRVVIPRSQASVSEILARVMHDTSLFLRCSIPRRRVYLGGAAHAKYVDYDVLEPYICSPLPAGVGRDSARYLFAGYVDSVGLLEYPVQNHVHTRIPLS